MESMLHSGVVQVICGSVKEEIRSGDEGLLGSTEDICSALILDTEGE